MTIVLEWNSPKHRGVQYRPEHHARADDYISPAVADRGDDFGANGSSGESRGENHFRISSRVHSVMHCTQCVGLNGAIGYSTYGYGFHDWMGVKERIG
jgi:hypothetical protein